MSTTQNQVEQSSLGKKTQYTSNYDPQLLFPIARFEKREELGIMLEPNKVASLPFFGVDIWNAYEVSWLNLRGKPQVAIASLTVSADSPNIIESKSLKLYLNSYNQTKFTDIDALKKIMQADLSHGFGASVRVTLTPSDQFNVCQFQELEGILLDRLDIDVETFDPQPHILKADHTCPAVEESLVSHLLKSNCLITNQPDWASVQITYVGAPIDQESLLRYLIGFRNHNEFHEQCVERIFMEIMHFCKPQKLAVYARYTRRGGIDINPWRSNFSTGKPPSNMRNARQ